MTVCERVFAREIMGWREVWRKNRHVQLFVLNQSVIRETKPNAS
jgi:hypothetical protein